MLDLTGEIKLIIRELIIRQYFDLLIKPRAVLIHGVVVYQRFYQYVVIVEMC